MTSGVLDGAHEQHAAQMRGRTDAGIGDGDGILVGLGVVDQPLQIGRLEVLAGDDGHRHLGDEADIFEGVQRVVCELPVQRRAGRHADVMEEQRIAVRLGVGDAAGAQRAAGAADILDDDLLAEILRHGFRDEARDRVGRAAGRKRHHNGDGAFRIGLRARGERIKRDGRGGSQSGNKFSHRDFLPGYESPTAARTFLSTPAVDEATTSASQ